MFSWLDLPAGCDLQYSALSVDATQDLSKLVGLPSEVVEKEKENAGRQARAQLAS